MKNSKAKLIVGIVIALVIVVGVWLVVDRPPEVAEPVVERPAEPVKEEPKEQVAKFNEAPMLREMVERGELPPVEERLPENPLVIEVNERIGEYGGIIRRGFTGPADYNTYTRWVFDALVRFSPDGSEVVPRLLESWESTPDYRTWTLRLRRGARWSDGEPFTADAIMFWYEDVLLNTELTPTIPRWMQNADGSVVEVAKVDDYTVTWTFKEPNTILMKQLANVDGGDRLYAAFLPAHYLKQYHAEYADAAKLAEMVTDAGFKTWGELISNRKNPGDNPGRPVMAAWKPVTSVADDIFILRRNPFFIGVDAEGNQLPYVDEVHFKFFSDSASLNLAAIAGEFDMQERHIIMGNFPVLKENALAGKYKVITWPTFGGSDATITFNQTHEADPIVGELMRNRDFRVALSYAIDREEIQESVFLGLGEIRQGVPAPWHPYFPGDEYAKRHTEFNLEKANEMLDGIGLTSRDSEGFRLSRDGQPISIEISVVPAFANWPDVALLVAADWQEAGIRTIVQIRERALHFEMRGANTLQTEVWNEDTTGFPFTGHPKFDPRTSPGLTLAPLVRQWVLSGGAEGVEPTPAFKRLMEIIDTGKTVGTEEQIELAQELFRLWVTELYQIGTVGLTPLVQGVVVHHNDLINVPLQLGNDWPLRTPGNANPEQFFFDQ